MTKCGQGCLETDEGALCVCPEGSILQNDGQACTGIAYRIKILRAYFTLDVNSYHLQFHEYSSI